MPGRTGPRRGRAQCIQNNVLSAKIAGKETKSDSVGVFTVKSCYFWGVGMGGGGLKFVSVPSVSAYLAWKVYFRESNVESRSVHI